MKIGVMVNQLNAMKGGTIPIVATEVEFDHNKTWAKETIEMIARFCRADSGGELRFTLPVLTATTTGVIEAAQAKLQAELEEREKLSAAMAETSRAIEALDLELVEIDLFSTPQLLLTRAVGASWQREAANEICADFPLRVKVIADRQAFMAAEKKRVDDEVAERNRQAFIAEQEAMAAWISEHGSELLKRRLEIEIDYEVMYKDERLAKELPGWSWHTRSQGSLTDPQEPSLSDFELLDQARLQLPDARLGRLSYDGSHVAYGEFLDKTVVLLAQEKAAEEDDEDVDDDN